MTRKWLLLASLAAACSGETSEEQCEISSTRLAVQAEDRNILGLGGAYPADTMMRGRADDLHHSQALRREAAWQTVAKVLAPVSTAKLAAGVTTSEVPLWQTWYAKDDTTRLFQHLYEGLTSQQQTSHERFSQKHLDEALNWNVAAVEELANWPLERREEYLAAIDSAEKLAGIGGIAQVSYSPSAMRHLLRSYPEILSCLAGEAPDAFVDTPGDSVQQIVREPVDLDRCTSQHLGPFYVGEGETLQVTLSGDGSDEAQTLVHRDGPGAHFVEVIAGITPLHGVVQIDYQSPNAPWASCLEGAFATDSVVIKASWRRTQFGETLPTYDTSGPALRTTLSNNATDGWGIPAGEADPGPGAIYTAERPNGNRYRLAALHIMSKELDHWQWITLWWSDSPGSDFGEDRPASISELGGPWSHYKMCTATMFTEGDPDPTGGYADSAPSLASALASVHGGTGAPSWCSNPYLEEGAGNMGTNCIGCHQHAGTTAISEDIIGDSEQFPYFGRTQLRNNFPHDYSWAPLTGDRLALDFKSVVDYFD